MLAANSCNVEHAREAMKINENTPSQSCALSALSMQQKTHAEQEKASNLNQSVRLKSHGVSSHQVSFNNHFQETLINE